MAQIWLLGSQIINTKNIYKLKENFLQILIFLFSTEILNIKFYLWRGVQTLGIHTSTGESFL